jgi:hypothetical protein
MTKASECFFLLFFANSTNNRGFTVGAVKIGNFFCSYVTMVRSKIHQTFRSSKKKAIALFSMILSNF